MRKEICNGFWKPTIFPLTKQAITINSELSFSPRVNLALANIDKHINYMLYYKVRLLTIWRKCGNIYLTKITKDRRNKYEHNNNKFTDGESKNLN